MTTYKVIAELEQLWGEAIPAFERDEEVSQGFRKLYDLLQKKVQVIEEFEASGRGQLSDQQEYAAAHACGRMRDAEAISQRRY